MSNLVKISDSVSTENSYIAASCTAVKLAYDKASSIDVGVTSVNGMTGDVNLSISAFPSGTKMLFNQSAAPTGWTKQTSVDNAALRVVSGNGGGTGGSIAFSTLFATGKTVSLSGNVGATTLTVAQMPSHTHNTGITTQGDSAQWLPSTNNNNNDTKIATGATGGSGSHTHALAGTATIALNVKYTDVIICAKD